jgi:hypothetical protein
LVAVGFQKVGYPRLSAEDSESLGDEIAVAIKKVGGQISSPGKSL